MSLISTVTILACSSHNSLDNLGHECMIDPDLELVEILQDEQDLVGWQGLAFTDFVHDEIKVSDHYLQAQLDQFIPTLVQVILLWIDDR